jgi:hypothetical protein
MRKPNRQSDPRTRVMHALNKDGMLACNPRDKEAAHRAEVEGIASEVRQRVTCRVCQQLMHRPIDQT